MEELRMQPIDSLLSEPVQISPDSSLSKIAGLFRERRILEVFLLEGTRCGIICARDLMKASNIEATKAATIMSYVPVASKQSSLGDIARIMSDYRIRAVPISDDHRIVAQANSSSILGGLMGKIGAETRVAAIASREPTDVESGESVAKARELMIRKRIDHLPVTKQRKLTGIITSSDIVSLMAAPTRLGNKSMKPESRGMFDFSVRELMEINPLTCSPNTTADRALEMILASRGVYILVTQWEELQGIATHRDFMRLLAEEEPESEVPLFIVGLPEDPFEAEATKAKFRRIVNQLRRVFPDILEARSVIKSKFSRPGKERGRYEVTVQVRTSSDFYTFSENGWELPAIYDVITDRLKRLMTQKQKPHSQRERQRQEIP
jgi:CBS domain-containing protein